MKIIYKKIAVAFIAITSIILLGQGCKKIETEIEPQEIKFNESDAQKIQKVKDNIAALQQKNGRQKTFELNQTFKLNYYDLEGNLVPKNSSLMQSLNSTCDFDDQGFSEAKIPSYTFFYECSLGYKIGYSFEVVYNSNIVKQHPNNPNNKTRGIVRIYYENKDTSFKPKFPTFLDTSFATTISDLGQAPGAPDGYNKYRVEFTTSKFIPDQFASRNDTYLDFRGIFVTDCPSMERFNVSFTPSIVNSPQPGQSGALQPCFHNDEIFLQPPGALPNSYRKIGIAGYDVTGNNCRDTYSTDAERPSLQEVQFSVDNGAWQNFDNRQFVSSNFGYYNSSFLKGNDFAIAYQQLPPSDTVVKPRVGNSPEYIPRKIKTRCRNWKYSQSQPSFPVPTTSNACVTSFWTEKINDYIIY